LLAIVILGIAAVQIFKMTDRRAFEESSRKRVQLMLENLQAGGTSYEQDAMGYWRVGHPKTANEDKANDFARFRSQGGLGGVQSFSITSTKLNEATNTYDRYVEIAFVVNSKPLRVRAKQARPLEWVK
jgi:hypothetical protein